MWRPSPSTKSGPRRNVAGRPRGRRAQESRRVRGSERPQPKSGGWPKAAPLAFSTVGLFRLWLMEAAKQNRSGHRDTTALLVAYRHGLRASNLARKNLCVTLTDAPLRTLFEIARRCSWRLWRRNLGGSIPIDAPNLRCRTTVDRTFQSASSNVRSIILFARAIIDFADTRLIVFSGSPRRSSTSSLVSTASVERQILWIMSFRSERADATSLIELRYCVFAIRHVFYEVISGQLQFFVS